MHRRRAVTIVLMAVVAWGVAAGLVWRSSRPEHRIGHARAGGSLDPATSTPARPARPVQASSEGPKARWVAAENARPGTTEWRIADNKRDLEVEGFVDRVSAMQGDTVTLHVAPLLGVSVQSFDATGAGPGTFGATQSGRVFDWSAALRIDARWQARPWFSLRFGTDLEWERYVVDADIQSTLQLRQLGLPITQEQVISHTQPLGNVGEFADAELKLGRWELHPGVRFDQFHWRDHTYGTFDPRLWARYALTESTALKGYTGIYHQAPSPFALDPALGNPALTPERAWQAGLGLEHRFTSDWSVSVEAFYDRRGALAGRVPAEALANGSVTNPLYLNQGLGRSYGVEVTFRKTD